jgi:two-component system cell cycle sensor histidine kinase/response regulator CckA
MPEMNGTQLVAELRKLKPDLRHVYMSGFTADLLRRDDGADVPEVLQKPFSLVELAGAVRTALAATRTKAT